MNVKAKTNKQNTTTYSTSLSPGRNERNNKKTQTKPNPLIKQKQEKKVFNKKWQFTPTASEHTVLYIQGECDEELVL